MRTIFATHDSPHCPAPVRVALFDLNSSSLPLENLAKQAIGGLAISIFAMRRIAIRRLAIVGFAIGASHNLSDAQYSAVVLFRSGPARKGIHLQNDSVAITTRRRQGAMFKDGTKIRFDAL